MSHLTEDQIDELLMGSLKADEAVRLREHAAGCEACAAKLAEIETPLQSFKAVTLAWSERRSATLPVRPTARRAGTRWGMGLAWGPIAAAVLLGAIIPVLRHEQNVRVQQVYRNAAKPATPANPTVAPTNSATTQNDNANTGVQENAQEIASDNRLLAMVDAELNAPVPTPGAATSGRGHSRTGTPDPLQD